MKKILFLFVVYTTCISGFNDEKKQFPFESYEDLYFISGGKKDQVKGQLSFKYAILPIHNSKIYTGYTQKFFWRVMDSSAPFEEIEHMPNLFWRWYPTDIFKYVDLGIYNHNSNGQDNIGNRSYDFSFIGVTFNKKIYKIKIFQNYKIFTLLCTG